MRQISSSDFELALKCPVLAAQTLLRPEQKKKFYALHLPAGAGTQLRQKMREKAFLYLTAENQIPADSLRREIENVHVSCAGFAAAADFLIPKQNGFDLFIVEPALSIKYAELCKAYFIRMVMEKAGKPIRKTFILCLNKKYKWAEPAEPKKIFYKEQIIQSTKNWHKKVSKIINQTLAYADGTQAPFYKGGKKCSYCYNNDLCKTEFPHQLPAEPPTDRPPEEIDLSGHIQTELPNGHCFTKPAELGNFLSTLQFPLSFLDFEAFQSPVPLWQQTAPFERLPFLYSLHRLDAPNAKLHHTAEIFFAQTESPRRIFVQSLIGSLSSTGSILVYNTAMEKALLSDCAKELPEYREQIGQIIDRFVDFSKPFSKRLIYKPEQGRRYSLKLISELFTDISYRSMELNSGYKASMVYLFLQTSGREKNMEKDLIEYCSLDTLSMVETYKTISRISREPDKNCIAAK